MSIRFTAARSRGRSVQMLGARGARLAAANDNVRGSGNDEMLRAALKHFAANGLGAADVARIHAEEAFFAGDSVKYRWWLGICRMLDRRMADAVAARRDAAGKA